MKARVAGVAFVARMQQGVSKFEFAVTVAVLAILAGVLLQRLAFYQDEAELVAVRQVESGIRAALEVRLTQAALPGRGVDLAALAQQNPLDLLVRKPANYAGEYYAPSLQEVAPGNWYFDRSDKTLIYLLNNSKSFGDSRVKLLKFKVKLLRLPPNPAKQLTPSEITSVTFERLD